MGLLKFQLSNSLLAFLELVFLVVYNAVSFVYSNLGQLFLSVFLLRFRFKVLNVLVAVA